MKRNLFCMSVMVLLAIISCKKGEEKGQEEEKVKAEFSYAVDGLFVVFSNSSKEATGYEWDFGDGTGSSTERNPSYTYNEGGEFVVTLTAKKGAQTDVVKHTVVVEAKEPEVNIAIDGDFADWESVSYALQNPAGEGGTLNAIKAVATAGDLNFYLEGTLDMSMDMMDIFLDSDNNSATGFIPLDEYPAGAGAEYLFEGTSSGLGTVYRHSGAQQTEFSWSNIYPFGEVVRFSEVKIQGDKKVVEFAIDRSKLETIAGGFSFCVLELNSADWNLRRGSIPVRGTATSKFLKVVLK